MPGPRQKPYLLVLVLVGVTSFAASLVLTYVLPMVAFFMMPTRAWQLAIGGVVALTVAQWHRLPAIAGHDRGMGRPRGDPADVYLVEPDHALSRHRRTVSRARRGVGDWRGLCLYLTGGRARPLPVADAGGGRVSYSWYLWHWPVLVLAPTAVGHPLGLTGRLAAVLVSAGLAVLTVRYIENPVRFAPSLRRSAARSLALGAAATAVAVIVGVALTIFTPEPVGRGPVAPTLSVVAAPAPLGYNPRLVRRRGAARVRAGAGRNPRIGRLSMQFRPTSPRRLPTLQSEANRPLTRRLYAPLDSRSRTPRVHERRHRIRDNGRLARRLECCDVQLGVPADRRATALAAGNSDQGGLPTAGSAGFSRPA